jgi:hypothetical protein
MKKLKALTNGVDGTSNGRRSGHSGGTTLAERSPGTVPVRNLIAIPATGGDDLDWMAIIDATNEIRKGRCTRICGDGWRAHLEPGSDRDDLPHGPISPRVVIAIDGCAVVVSTDV